MNKIFYTTIILLLMTTTCVDVSAHQINHHKPTIKEQKEFDKMLDDRLHLTQEQKDYIKTNRTKNIKEMKKTVSEMENLHKKIKDIYLLGIPKYQADLRSAPYKAELAILKQNAKKRKIENRKNFENILSKEQKIELEKIREERRAKIKNKDMKD